MVCTGRATGIGADADEWGKDATPGRPDGSGAHKAL
jgi:hypothetical protein